MDPNNAPPTACTIPTLSPILLGVDSLSTNTCAKGITGPSANPIIKRAANKVPKPIAKPDPKEHIEKINIATMNVILFLFLDSDQAVVK